MLDRKISMVGSGNRLSQLTSVPPGWPLETVLDAWAHLKCLGLDRSAAAKAAVTDRLEDLWFSEAEEAERWLTRTQTLYHLPPGRDIDQLFPAVYLHAMAELKKWDVRNFTSTGLVRCPSEGPSNCLCHEDCKELAYMLAPHNRSAREAGTGHNLDAADGELREVRIPWWNTMLHSRQFFEFALASMEPPAMHRAAEAEAFRVSLICWEIPQTKTGTHRQGSCVQDQKITLQLEPSSQSVSKSLLREHDSLTCRPGKRDEVNSQLAGFVFAYIPLGVLFGWCRLRMGLGAFWG